MSSHSKDQYFVPDASVYPFASSIALFFIAMGGASYFEWLCLWAQNDDGWVYWNGVVAIYLVPQGDQ